MVGIHGEVVSPEAAEAPLWQGLATRWWILAGPIFLDKGNIIRSPICTEILMNKL